MKTTQEILREAKSAKAVLCSLDTETKNNALLAMADALVENQAEILTENQKDLDNAKGTISEVMLDRLALSEERILGMAEGIRQVAQLPDPVGEVLDTVVRPSGIVVEKTAVPMGVVAIIYESRPNVTSDAAALALKSGNVCVLRGGKEAFLSADAIVRAMRKGLNKVGLPETLINLVQDTTRQSANELMNAVGYVDLLIPRGGAGLIKACTENAKVPCIQTGTGICHIYIDKKVDYEKALDIVENAKTSRPSVCNACEVLLVHNSVSDHILPLIKERLKYLTDAAEMVRFLFTEPAVPPVDQIVPKKLDAAKTKEVLEKSKEFVKALPGLEHEAQEELAKKMAEEMGIKLGDFMMPIRMAVTGSRVSPPLMGSILILGVEKSIERIERTLATF